MMLCSLGMCTRAELTGAVTECTHLEQRKEVCFCGRQGLACQQLEQVPKVVAAVEGDPLDLHGEHLTKLDSEIPW